MKKIIGVTGSFGTGKTTVARFFGKLGAYVIDADRIVHELYRKDKKIKEKIKRVFGKGVIRKNKIDRKKLALSVFRDKKKIKTLCAIVYPEVIRRIRREIKKSKKAKIVIDAPLLMEAGLSRRVDFVIVVKATRKNQIERCKAKGFKQSDVRRRQAIQMPLAIKVKRADFVINNNGTIKKTKKEVVRLWQKL